MKYELFLKRLVTDDSGTIIVNGSKAFCATAVIIDDTVAKVIVGRPNAS
jgi:hypothetical protein